MQAETISVIIPVYNVKPYLEKCLNSILTQTYKNIEIIIIDDGSTDGSSEICDIYAETYDTIKVIHKLNGGASSARNLGLEIASGEYVGFVDSDDFIKSNMYEILMDLIKKYKADISMCGVYTNENSINHEQGKHYLLDHNVAMQELLDDKIASYPVNKLYKRDLWDKIHFPEGMTLEDLYIMPYVFERAERVVVTSQPLYFYYSDRPGNVSGNINTKHIIDFSTAFIERFNFALSRGIQNRNIILKKAVSYSLGAYGFCSNEYKTYGGNIQKFLKDNIKEIIQDADIDILRKIIAFATAYTPIYGWISAIRRIVSRRFK